ncbi:hypothetical protein G4O51_11070 [Candidatus Bathyarchaeota archaeon A05DMB-2]|nr:hypothetical protein [Candidatus Bathyarchaeota archaeon A05DMB-2]
MSKSEPKICPNCPLISFLPIIMAARACYTRQKDPLTPHKICQMLRAFAKQNQLTSDACPYFSQKETMERYLSAEAEAAR